MKKPGKNIVKALKASLFNFNKLGLQLDQLMEQEAKTMPECDHGVVFDEALAKDMTATEIKQKYPRLDGTCPKGCGYVGIAYASSMHYYMGDW